LEDGTELVQEILVTHGAPCAVLSWRLLTARPGVTLEARPFLSGRDYHSLHKENAAFQFNPVIQDQTVTWRPYPGVPSIQALANGVYRQDAQWYRNFFYTEESARGLDATEDLAAPGVFRWDLSEEQAVLILSSPDTPASHAHHDPCPLSRYYNAHANERLRRSRFASPLDRAADAYIVARRPHTAPAATSRTPVAGSKTLLAGYPWFTDWGRDAFIALRGLCLATGRLEDARSILLDWAGAVSEGMLPNRFPDSGEAPEYNSVDASLWFVIAVHDYLLAAPRTPASPSRPTPPRSSSSVQRGKGAGTSADTGSRDEAALLAAVESILEGYSRGTRYGIRADADGLLACGVPGVQLTWMDSKIGDWVVTPRMGKPVEIQALWLNALAFAARHHPRWAAPLDLGLRSFAARFWNEADQCLYDVVDVNHQAGTADASFRPNQILAVGGLPMALLEKDRARRVVEAVGARLLTPLGLRSLDPKDPHYVPYYMGGVHERDSAYHQGTVWPWLLGPYVEAWVRVRQGTDAAKRQAREQFLNPALVHLNEAGLGHVSEITDAESPFTPRGCPVQAWSVGELLRLDRDVLAPSAPAATQRKSRHVTLQPAHV
jgi:glycogen debranching enzyme